MMKRLLMTTAAASLLAIGASAYAQDSNTGTVTGHVYCADTQKPARFANVRLQPVDAQGGRFGGRGGFATTATCTVSATGSACSRSSQRASGNTARKDCCQS